MDSCPTRSKGIRTPVGAMVYGSIAGDAWYRAQYLLQDQKIGHYMHIPPRAVFFSQIFGSFIGVPINYGVIRWILNTKAEYLTGRRIDPLHQWTGQDLHNSLTVATQYVLIVNTTSSCRSRKLTISGPPPPLHTNTLPPAWLRLPPRCYRPTPPLPPTQAISPR